MTELTRPQLLKLCGNVVPRYSLRADDPVAFQQRTSEQEALHELIVSTVLGDYEDKATFGGRTLVSGEKIEWDLLVDKYMPGAWVGQRTGSCVGTNFFNMLLCQILIESIVKKTGEQADPDYFWPYTYGWGRYFGGMRNEGEGSFLSAQFRASEEKGIPHLESGQFPAYQSKHGARWLPSKVEYEWSDADNIPRELDQHADDHLVVDGAMVRSLEACRDAIWLGPFGMASMFGTSRVYEKEGVKLADWDTRWAHNMFVCGWWRHKKLGELVKIGNKSWLPSQFASFWTPIDEFSKVFRDRATELCVVRDFAGLEAGGVDLDWLIDFIMSL